VWRQKPFATGARVTAVCALSWFVNDVNTESGHWFDFSRPKLRTWASRERTSWHFEFSFENPVLKIGKKKNIYLLYENNTQLFIMHIIRHLKTKTILNSSLLSLFASSTLPFATSKLCTLNVEWDVKTLIHSLVIVLLLPVGKFAMADGARCQSARQLATYPWQRSRTETDQGQSHHHGCRQISIVCCVRQLFRYHVSGWRLQQCDG